MTIVHGGEGEKIGTIGKNFAVSSCVVLTVIAVLALFSGCSGGRMNISIEYSPHDQPMYGRSADRLFVDSSVFTFPLSIRWEYDAGAGFGHAPMIVAGNTLFAGTLRGELHAVNLADGERLGYLKTYSPVFAAPALFDGTLVFCTESGEENLAAFDIENREIRWSKDLGGITASPLVYRSLLIATGLNGAVAAFDTLGNEEWIFKTKSEIRSSPAASAGTVFCANTKGEVFALDASDGSLKWKGNVNGAVYAGLTVYGSTLIVASRDSSVYLFNAENGSIIRRIVVGNKVMASPAVQNGMLCISTLDGVVLAYDIATGEQRWQFNARSVINTTPVFSANALFVVSLDKNIYALDPANGKELWKYELPVRIKSTPILWNNSLIVAGEGKIIYRFDSAAAAQIQQ
ncbi:MAG: outer membrane protein assembly factor BamB family protein [Bacteroidota bacterium]